MVEQSTIPGRILIRYRESAERLNIPLSDYLRHGYAGERYCSTCLVWKKRRYFHEYSNTSTYFSGTCKACIPARTAPAKIDNALWGPALVAAAKLDMDVVLYIQKRREGFRWCTDHKAWFDASDMLEGNNPQITRCRDCNRTRQQEFRDQRKRRKNAGKISTISESEIIPMEEAEELVT